MTKFSGPGRFIFFPLMGVAFLFIISGVVMLLWNSILPAVFAVSAITFWQAMGILVLSKILFGFGFKGGRGGWGKHMYWQKQMKEQFADMTPEERASFREEWKRRAAGWHGNPACGPYSRGWQQPEENKENSGAKNE